jgi:hypothetical protein
MDIQKALNAIRSTEPTTRTAQLRELLPAIEARMAEGVRLAVIHRALLESGAIDFRLTLASLRTYLSRFRRSRRAAAPSPSAESTAGE